MLRVQMYELSLKQDLQQLFGVPEEKTERMNLSLIFRYYVNMTSGRTHPLCGCPRYRQAKERYGSTSSWHLPHHSAIWLEKLPCAFLKNS